MCDDLPIIDYGLGGWHPCTPMQELWFLHQEHARRFRLQLQRDGNQAVIPTRLYRDNPSTIRVAEGKVAPEAMPMSIKNHIFECPNGEN